MNMLVNFEGTKGIIDECRYAKVKRLIYASSVTVVFNDQELHNADENIPYLLKVDVLKLNLFF